MFYTLNGGGIFDVVFKGHADDSESRECEESGIEETGVVACNPTHIEALGADGREGLKAEFALARLYFGTLCTTASVLLLRL